MIGTAICEVTNFTDNQISCITGSNAAGSYPLIVQILPNGYANMNFYFIYNLSISSISNVQGKNFKIIESKFFFKIFI